MKGIYVRLSTALAITLILVGISFAQLIYDDFSNSDISRDRWGQGEFVREIDVQNHRLVSKLGSPHSSTVAIYPHDEVNSLSFFDPTAINSIQADVTIFESDATANAYGEARLGGTWYRTSFPGEDVWAEIAIRRELGGLVASWYIARTQYPLYGPFFEVISGQFSSPISEGIPCTLLISYDSLAHAFEFGVGSEIVTVTSATLDPRVSEAGNLLKTLDTKVVTGDPSSSAYISATFINVYINNLLYEDFSSLPLDPRKWWIGYSGTNGTYDEFVREISGGCFRSKIRSFSQYTFDLYNHIEFVNPSEIDLIRAKITPILYQNRNDQWARVEAYITGRFYNDGTGPGNFGDVEAKIWIGGEGSTPMGSTPAARWVVQGRLPGDEFIVALSYGTFSLPIRLGSAYILSLGWIGNRLNFRIEDVELGLFEEANYVPTTNTYPPVDPWKEIGTYVMNATDLEKTIEALFDDVMVSGFDVPVGHWAYDFIMALYDAGITNGCQADDTLTFQNEARFCPEDSITRGQMAVFIEAALGNPANSRTGRFADVPVGHPFCGFIERLAEDGITGGCTESNFCPDDPVTRGQMAAFIEAALGNPPNPCTGQFADVPLDNPFCGFIERLAGDGITGGCGGGNFCPDDPVTRAQMAVFLVTAF
jgi:hypothetical protein